MVQWAQLNLDLEKLDLRGKVLIKVIQFANIISYDPNIHNFKLQNHLYAQSAARSYHS